MARPWESVQTTAAHRAAYADAERTSFWLDDLPARDPHPPLEGRAQTDLAIVGGGFTGLWAALYAKELDPDRDVCLLETDVCGAGASGRNGGFLSYSLTHGIENGLARFDDEIGALERLGLAGFRELAADLGRHGIDGEFEDVGGLSLELEAPDLAEMHAFAGLMREHGHEVDVLDREQAQALVHSPLYLAAYHVRTGEALVHPGKLAEGLRETAVRLGVRIHERTPATALRRDGATTTVTTPSGALAARRVLLATSAYPGPLRTPRRFVAPVYDYVLMTEPLNAGQRAAIGWEGRQGLDDGGNQFHYYRLTRDDRILFGGYDAVYRFRGPVRADLDDHDPTFARLSTHFFTTFPQLEGVRFTHRWGGAIDTCSRFSVFFGTAQRGSVAYVTGYTGLGVGASRFGGRTALDLLDGRETEATRLRYVRSKPLPFPPEPLRSAAIQLTRNRLAAADRDGGRRGAWLRTLDRLGLGFDS